MQDKGCPTSMFISLSGIEIFVVHPFFCRTFSIKRHMSLKGVIFDDKKFKTKGNPLNPFYPECFLFTPGLPVDKKPSC
jgi:hypothetical protein